MSEEIFSDQVSIGSWGGATHMTTQTVALVLKAGAGGYICPRHFDEYKMVYPNPSDACEHCEMEFQESRANLKERRANVAERLKELASNGVPGSDGAGGPSSGGGGGSGADGTGIGVILSDNGTSGDAGQQQWNQQPKSSPDGHIDEPPTHSSGNNQNAMVSMRPSGVTTLGRSISVSSAAGGAPLNPSQHYQSINDPVVQQQQPYGMHTAVVGMMQGNNAVMMPQGVGGNGMMQSGNSGMRQANNSSMMQPSNHSGAMPSQQDQQQNSFALMQQQQLQASHQQQQPFQQQPQSQAMQFDGNSGNANGSPPMAGNMQQQQQQLNQQEIERTWLAQQNQPQQQQPSFQQQQPSFQQQQPSFQQQQPQQLQQGFNSNGVSGVNLNSNMNSMNMNQMNANNMNGATGHGANMNMNNVVSGMNNLNMSNAANGMNNMNSYQHNMMTPSMMNSMNMGGGGMHSMFANQQSSPNGSNVFPSQQQHPSQNMQQSTMQMQQHSNQNDALASQIQRMQQIQDWMLLQKEQECGDLKVKLEQALELQQQLRVENALLTEKLHQQEQRMQQELKLIKLAALQRQQQQKQQEKQKKLAAQRQLQEQRMLVLASSNPDDNPHQQQFHSRSRNQLSRGHLSNNDAMDGMSAEMGGMTTEEVVDEVEELESQAHSDHTPLRIQDGSVYSNEQRSIHSGERFANDNPTYPPSHSEAEEEAGNEPGDDTNHTEEEDEEEEDQWPSVRRTTLGNQWPPLGQSSEDDKIEMMASNSAPSFMSPGSVQSGSVQSGSTTTTANRSRKPDFITGDHGSNYHPQQVNGISNKFTSNPFNVPSASSAKGFPSGQQQPSDNGDYNRLAQGKAKQQLDPFGFSASGKNDVPTHFEIDDLSPPSVPLEETVTIGTTGVVFPSNLGLAPLNQVSSFPPLSEDRNNVKKNNISSTAGQTSSSHVVKNSLKGSSTRENPIVVEDDPGMDTWSYLGDEKKMATPYSNNNKKLPPKPPQSMSGSSSNKGVSWTDDGASVGQSVASSTFGEDRIKVTDAQILDPYGDQGSYTGIILRSTGMPHGAGKMVYAEDKRTYDGEWRHGRWHGFGRATFANGDCYAGEYRFDQRHGRGRYEWHDGRVYDGMFREDKRHGKGKFLWPDGAAYEGEFRNGQREGQGVYTFSDGGRYEGSWKDGRYSGFGICSWEDGRCYKGEWLNGMAHGRGVETFPDGTVRHDGSWVEDEPVLNQ